MIERDIFRCLKWRPWKFGSLYLLYLVQLWWAEILKTPSCSRLRLSGHDKGAVWHGLLHPNNSVMVILGIVPAQHPRNRTPPATNWATLDLAASWNPVRHFQGLGGSWRVAWFGGKGGRWGWGKGG